jgi:ABC-type arginine transport system permease subunit
MSTGRLAVTLFVLLAFTLQSYVTQIHIHGASWSTAVTADMAKVPQPGKTPAGDDQGTCPLCQIIAHAGQFITPSAVAIALPALAALHVAIEKDTATVTHSTSHSWKSRAPPRN